MTDSITSSSNSWRTPVLTVGTLLTAASFTILALSTFKVSPFNHRVVHITTVTTTATLAIATLLYSCIGKKALSSPIRSKDKRESTLAKATEYYKLFHPVLREAVVPNASAQPVEIDLTESDSKVTVYLNAGQGSPDHTHASQLRTEFSIAHSDSNCLLVITTDSQKKHVEWKGGASCTTIENAPCLARLDIGFSSEERLAFAAIEDVLNQMTGKPEEVVKQMTPEHFNTKARAYIWSNS